MRTTIDVVCPTFNSSQFIERTLASVLNQTRRPDTLIISDDGSTDDTLVRVHRVVATLPKSLKIEVLANSHGGPGAARNVGIQMAKSDWIAFLDSDDLWASTKLERVEAAIVDSPHANFISHDEVRLSRDGRQSPLIYGRNYDPLVPMQRQLYLANMFSTSAVICRRELLLCHGTFDETLMSAQDYELWLRLSSHLKPVFIREALGSYVERAGNISSGKLLNRMGNEFLIAWRHRKTVSRPLVATRMVRILASYCKQYLIARF